MPVEDVVRHTVADDFGGGMNNSDSERQVPPNQHDLISNLLVEGSDLRRIWGRELKTDPPISGLGPMDAVWDWTTRSYGERVTYRIAIRGDSAGGNIWIETATPGVYQPLYNASSDPTTGYVLGNRWRGSIATAGGYLYITGLGMKQTKGTEVAASPLVWEGFCDISHTASVAAYVPGYYDLVTLDTPCEHVQVGDRITITDGGPIRTRTIIKVTDAGATLQVAYLGQTYPAGTAVSIVRMNYMGIEAPLINAFTNQPQTDSVEVWSTNSGDAGKTVMISGMLDSGIYKTEVVTLRGGTTGSEAVATSQTRWVLITHAVLSATSGSDVMVQTSIDKIVVCRIYAGDTVAAYPQPLSLTSTNASGNLSRGKAGLRQASKIRR